MSTDIYSPFKRYNENPIIEPEDLPYPANTVFNAGATLFNDEIILLLRVEDFRGGSHLTIARSKNGVTNWTFDNKPTLIPETDDYPEEYWGIEDPRITYLEELKKYGITYTSYSQAGPLISLILTEDFKSFTRLGPIMPPDNKDSALFPRKFNNKWLLIHRPSPADTTPHAHMWISSSPDLIHWGQHKMLIKARPGGWWDSYKIGLGPQPIETDEGWLLLYHGVKQTVSGNIYRIGLVLLDLDDPGKVIYRGNRWVFGPIKNYEIVGDVPNVTFPCGIVQKENTDELIMYYGAADTSIAAATVTISDLLDYLKQDCS